MSKVLILDDEKLIRWSLHQILSGDGHEVDVAASTDEALRFASAHPYHIILADLEVCGDQGEAFFLDLMAGQRDAKLVILTAMPKDDAERTLADCPISRIIEKPFAAEDIKMLVRNALSLDIRSKDPSKEV